MMKQTKRHIICVLMLLLLPALLSGCSDGGENAATFNIEEGLDLDLTKLSSTMIYAEVFNMRYEPDDYYGKRVRIAGLFSAYQNPLTGEYYYNCIIPDATACCSQGLQFFPADDMTYPDDFPEQGTTITLRGTFSLDEENVYMCALTDAVIESAEG